ncbi:Transmembrane protein [Fagus crenata]
MAFSYVVSIAAVPTTRNLKLNNDKPSVKDLLAQDAMDLKDSEELFDVGDGFIEGRMDFETLDYKPIISNPGHDPKTPGKP